MIARLVTLLQVTIRLRLIKASALVALAWLVLQRAKARTAHSKAVKHRSET